MSEPQNLSYPDEKRSSQRSQSNTNWRDKTSAIVISKRVWRVYLCMLVYWICLFFSFFLCTRTLTQVVVDSSSFKVEEFLHKMAISFLELTSWTATIILLLRTGTWSSAQFSCICDDSWLLVCSICITVFSSTVPMRPLVGLRPPSNSFILSLHLTITLYLSPVAVQDTTPEGVLSLCWCSLTLTLTTSIGIWHSAGATKSWFLVLQLSCSPTTFLLISISRVEGGWGWVHIGSSESMLRTTIVSDGT